MLPKERKSGRNSLGSSCHCQCITAVCSFSDKSASGSSENAGWDVDTWVRGRLKGEDESALQASCRCFTSVCSTFSAHSAHLTRWKAYMGEEKSCETLLQKTEVISFWKSHMGICQERRGREGMSMERKSQIWEGVIWGHTGADREHDMTSALKEKEKKSKRSCGE